MKSHKYTNLLINEKSPYLLQHAHNPVEWYPWGEAAFARAGKENKPIFLSIGYSTCHWCHVMEEEVFEDEEAAAVLNKFFILIKVDREERPDVDQFYMKVSQLMTGSGGWPLNVIMTPDKEPFYTATYIPKYGNYGRPGIMKLAEKIADILKNNPAEIAKAAAAVMKELKQITRTPENVSLGNGIPDKAAGHLASTFDKENGGFGVSPKFPSPHNLLFLLRYWNNKKNGTALGMVKKTLAAMRNGGVYDHIGFGFHRYSTDPRWFLPHFEKMLYDQAMLVMAYIEAYQATGDESFKSTSEEVLSYVLRDMTAPGGGFYTAEDADSEGKEGKFYLWTHNELAEHLSTEELGFAAAYFNVRREGNYHEEATGAQTGENILYRTDESRNIPGGIDMKKIRKVLFDIREKRIHPYKDDKILTDWNGLMIAALAKASRVFKNPEYLEAAKRGAGFILKTLQPEPGRLLHRYRLGEAAIDGFLDDYAFFTWGLLEIFEATFDAGYLTKALQLADHMAENFFDEQDGGFYLGTGAEDLIRQKEWMDSAMPSGNSGALTALFKLSRLTGQTRYKEMAKKTADANSRAVSSYPHAFTHFLSGLDYVLGNSFEIVVAGGREESREILEALDSMYLPSSVVLFKPAGEKNRELIEAAPFLKFYKPIDGKPTIYVCRNFQCSRPVHSIDEMKELLTVREEI